MHAPRFHAIPLMLSLLLLLLWCGAGWAEEDKGKLDDFENDVQTTEQHEPDDAHHHDKHDHHKHDRDDHDHDKHDDGEAHATVILGHAAGDAIGALGRASWQRAMSARDAGLTPRRPGDALLPMAQVQVAYRRVAGDITALDTRAEFGFGPMGLLFDESHYQERSPSDTLTVQSCYALYRMSPSNNVEVDLGLGGVSFLGDTRTNKAALTLPIRYQSTTRWGFALRPAWASRYTDVDAGVQYGGRYVALNAGYRWVESPHVALNGPYLGLSCQW